MRVANVKSAVVKVTSVKTGLVKLKNKIKLSVFIVLLQILVSQVMASVVEVVTCDAKVEIIKVETHANYEWISLKVLEKSDNSSCQFLLVSNSYISLVKSHYQGKFLKVPELKPRQLKVGQSFEVKVTQPQPQGKRMVWELKHAEGKLPAGTSFWTNSPVSESK